MIIACWCVLFMGLFPYVLVLAWVCNHAGDRLSHLLYS